jgi:hypothetical protein
MLLESRKSAQEAGAGERQGRRRSGTSLGELEPVVVECCDVLRRLQVLYSKY